jgi:hypothetical protein
VRQLVGNMMFKIPKTMNKLQIWGSPNNITWNNYFNKYKKVVHSAQGRASTRFGEMNNR